MERKHTVLALAIIGTLFSGYLTSQWFSGVCSGGCSILWGYPTCLYGLVMYLAILVAAIVALWKEKALRVVFWVSVAGMLFSLYFSVLELIPCQFCYWLGLPNCVYGFVMYAILAWLSNPGCKPKPRRTNRRSKA